eukprot:scaffold7067_cov245-Pinguiococcus_pyrenoidosus.AAC.8
MSERVVFPAAAMFGLVIAVDALSASSASASSSSSSASICFRSASSSGVSTTSVSSSGVSSPSSSSTSPSSASAFNRFRSCSTMASASASPTPRRSRTFIPKGRERIALSSGRIGTSASTSSRDDRPIGRRLVADGHDDELRTFYVERAQHLRTADVAEEDRKALVASTDRSLGIHVEGHVANELLIQQVADHPSDAPVSADHDDVLCPRGLDDLLGVSIFADVVAEPRGVLEALGDRAAHLGRQGRGRHAQGSHVQEKLRRLPGDQAEARREPEGNEGELATLGQQSTGLLRGAQRELAHEAESGDDGRLQPEHANEHDGHGAGVRDDVRQVNLESHGDEEEAKEQPAKRRDICFDLEAVLRLAQEHAGQERPQRVAQAKSLGEERHCEHRDEDDREEGLLRLAPRDDVEELIKRGAPRRGNQAERHGRLHAGQNKSVRHARLRARAKALRHHQQGHHSEVLEKQDAEGRATVPRAQLALVAEQLQHEGRAAEREASADHDRRGERHASGRRGHRRDHHARYCKLRQAKPEDVSAHRPQALQAELQAHLKKEKDDTELRKALQQVHVRDQRGSSRPEDQAEAEEPKNRRHPHALAQRHHHRHAHEQQHGVSFRASDGLEARHDRRANLGAQSCSCLSGGERHNRPSEQRCGQSKRPLLPLRPAPHGRFLRLRNLRQLRLFRLRRDLANAKETAVRQRAPLRRRSRRLRTKLQSPRGQLERTSGREQRAEQRQ